MTALPQPEPDLPPGPQSLRPERPRPPGGTAADPWPWTDTGGEARIRLSRPGELVGAVPVLIGFHPQNSLVLVGMAGPQERGRIEMTVRVDLPPGPSVRRVVDEAVSVLAGCRPERAVAVVIRAGASRRRGRRDVAVAARRALRWAGIEPMAVLWTSGTGAGDRWSCYPLPGQQCGCSGTVPDPSATAVAVAAVVRGRAVLPDRAAVAAQLDGGSADHERRSRLRDAARVSGCPGSRGPDAGLLAECLTAAAAGRLMIDDRLARDFRVAFDDPVFRDDALRSCLGPQAPHAEQLWAVLVRSLPEPERSHPAALLAACALLRGDGALAGLAVERALEWAPDHILGAVVDTSLRGALTPGETPGTYAGPAGLRRLLTAMLDLDEPRRGPEGGSR